MNRLAARVTPPGNMNTSGVLAILMDFVVLCVSCDSILYTLFA